LDDGFQGKMMNPQYSQGKLQDARQTLFARIFRDIGIIAGTMFLFIAAHAVFLDRALIFRVECRT
jgi:hypothetical protein